MQDRLVWMSPHVTATEPSLFRELQESTPILTSDIVVAGTHMIADTLASQCQQLGRPRITS